MIQPKDFFVLRQPAYPISTLTQFYERLLTEPLADLLRQHYQDPLAQEALFVASPRLYERFQKWLAGETLSEEAKLLATLHKYFVRMCSRPTPYGLFAGCATGTFGEHSRFRAARSPRPFVRLDMDGLLAIRSWLIAQPAIRAQLKLFPNSSLYPVGSSLRYVEHQFEKDRRNYYISVAGADQYLKAVLQAAQSGATLPKLTAALTALNATPKAAKEYVEQLIECQLLTFEIEPTVTGVRYLDRLAEQIAALPNAEAAANSLRQLLESLRLPDRMTAYAQVRRWFADHGIEPLPADLVQVDAFFENPTLQLSERARQHLQRDLEKLLVINQPPHIPDLEAFRRRFLHRYEDEEVPLATALDSEFGVGYGTETPHGVGYAPLVDDLTYGSVEAAPTANWDWWQSLVMEKYAEALRYRPASGGADEIVLSEADLAYIGSRQKPLNAVPFSFYAFGTLLARSAKSLDEGDFRFNLLACKGPSALNLLSRFGEGDPALADHIQACAAAEEAHHPDVIIAEIVHLPEDRVGNILSRPVIHAYEIPYLGQSVVSPDCQIPLTDLLVSVKGGTIILRSKRLNKRVVTRLTNAHNHRNGLPIYRFLCDLQAQTAHLDVAWNWGVLSTQAYLPRVRYRSIILSRATWQLACADLTPNNPLQLVAQLKAAGLPNAFVLAQGDNELYISMYNQASLDLLAQAIRQSDRIRLVEFLATPDACPLADKRDFFTHELIVPFQNTAAPVLPGLSQNAAELPPRKFSIGSEWFYIKIYTGEKTSDALLVEVIYPVVQQLLRDRIAEEFFFLRYQDTDPHLRLRFRGNPKVQFYHHVMLAMEKALHESVESGVVHRIQIDTYVRELERYGMQHVSLCESLFHCDSLSTLGFLTRTGELFDEDQRFAFAIRKIDRLLSGTGLTPDVCHAILSRMKEDFFQEFGGEPKLRQQLNEKHRTYRHLLTQALAPDFFLAEGLDQWNCTQTDLLAKVSLAFAQDPPYLHSIVGSLIHMVVNRLFPSKQREYELILYHCLTKHYDSVRARTLGNGQNLPPEPPFVFEPTAAYGSPFSKQPTPAYGHPSKEGNTR